MENLDIRTRATSNNVKLWQVAEELGITDSSLSRKLRRELDQATKQRIFDVIDYLGKKGEWRSDNKKTESGISGEN